MYEADFFMEIFNVLPRIGKINLENEKELVE